LSIAEKECNIRVHIDDMIREWSDKCEDLEMVKCDAELRADRY
jgi:hypothetical protein